MVQKIEIGKYIRVDELAESGYAKCIRFPRADLYLPTEFVITEPTVCAPATARVFDIECYLLDGDVVTYGEAMNRLGDKFKGTSYLTDVYFWEVWEDDGDDGHVWFKHRGYIASTIKIPTNRVYPLDEIRLLMRDQWR